MSLNLTNRLDKLENEIRLMLMLQKCGNQDCCTDATTVTTKSNQIMQSAEMGATTNNTKGDGQRFGPTRCPISCRKTIPSPRSSIAGDSPTRIGKNSSQSCCCAVAAKFMETHISRPPSRDGRCSCGRSPERELEIERQHRKEMEEEVNRLKLQIADMLQSKCMALNMTKQLKQRYEKMKGAHEDTATKLSNLQRENEFLARSLEKEKMEKGKTSSSVQVTKDLGQHSIKKMKEKDAKIKSLNDSLLSLSKTVEDKEFEKKRLEHEKHRIHEKLKMNKDITKKLSETNAKLAKSVKQKHDSFLAIRNKAGKYEKELGQYKEEVRRSQMELAKLKSEITRERSRQESLLSTPKAVTENLEEKLKKTKDKERRASETIQILSQQLRDLEHKDPRSLEKELQRVNKELKAVQQKYEEALNKLKQYENDEKKRAEAFAGDLAAKESKYLEEKEQMKQLIEQLQSSINEYMKRIEELEAVKQQQDIVIKSQTEQLNSKEEQIKLRERENDLVKEQCLELDKQVDNLRTSIDEFEKIGSKTMVQNTAELKERINSLTNEVDSLKADLKEEQLNSNTKDKVIDDQYNTIEELKRKLANFEHELRNYSALSRESEIRVRTSKEQVERMSRELIKEKEYTRQTVSHLTSMQKQKKKLEKDVEKLEEAYEERSTISFLQKLDQGQKQWNEEKQILTKERDRAIEAAKLATKTLMETMDDFQGQIKSQQKLQKIVTDIISSKSQSRMPPCVRRREAELYKQMQVAIPCRPATPQCNLRCNFPIHEDHYYMADSNNYYSGHSDSDDTAGVSGIFNFLGQYSGNYTPVTRANASRSASDQPASPSIPRPLSAPWTRDSRCTNPVNNQCQCCQKSSIPVPVGEQGKQKKCYCRKK